ncbi:BQ2448_3991 [Microbotryum intermedium]|uniref:BQ2448_3991 protein n=1 Tax=Microbotryum intermedium TaxID=269621 RepID=A0A238FKN8_9BASI|nr:BQ2448_3991 [Microbotryum intermedium]
MPSNTTSSTEPTSFDTDLAHSLLPSIIALSHSAALLHSAPATAPTDPTSTAASTEAALNAAKSDLGRQATQLRNALATLKTQAHYLEMGDLSLQDQAWIIKELQQKLDHKRDQVKALRDVIPTPQATSTDIGDMDTST